MTIDLRPGDRVYLDDLVHEVYLGHGNFGFTACEALITLMETPPYRWRRCELLPGGLVTCLLCIGDRRG